MDDTWRPTRKDRIIQWLIDYGFFVVVGILFFVYAAWYFSNVPAECFLYKCVKVMN